MYLINVHALLDTSPEIIDLAQIEPSPRVNAIKQPLFEDLLIAIHRQLQQIDTCARTRQPCLIASTVPYTEPRIQIAKAQQWCPWRTCDELEHFLPIAIVKVLHDLPEHCHRRMLHPVIADSVETTILRVRSQIGN